MKDLKFDSLNVVKGKYWSTIGFDFLEMLIGMTMGDEDEDCDYVRDE